MTWTVGIPHALAVTRDGEILELTDVSTLGITPQWAVCRWSYPGPVYGLVALTRKLLGEI